MSSLNEIRQALAEARAAEARLKAVVAAADANGIKQLRIAEAAEVTGPTVRRWVDEVNAAN